MPEMKIEYLPIDSVRPYDRNAKKHPPEQVQHIANSIKEFGWKQPIVIDEDGVVIIGHGRLLAAKLLEQETVPCVKASDLTPKQIKALRLADNKTNESGYDFSVLEIELAEIEDDLSAFGFGEKQEELPANFFDTDNERRHEHKEGHEYKCPYCSYKWTE